MKMTKTGCLMLIGVLAGVLIVGNLGLPEIGIAVAVIFGILYLREAFSPVHESRSRQEVKLYNIKEGLLNDETVAVLESYRKKFKSHGQLSEDEEDHLDKMIDVVGLRRE